MDRLEEIRIQYDEQKRYGSSGFMMRMDDISYLLSEVDRLTAALTESQRRADAAAEDAKQGSVCRTCHYLNNGCEPLNLDAGCRKWQWRGPQETGKERRNEHKGVH